MDWTTLLFGFKGRINRAKYWLAALLYIVVMVALIVFFIYALGDFSKDRIGEIVGTSLLFIAIGGVFLIFLVWSSFATGIKRLHDRGKSGWWMLVFFVLPAIIGIGADSIEGTSSFALNAISIALNIWGFVELGCLRGTQGPNEYGPDPLTEDVVVVQA